MNELVVANDDPDVGWAARDGLEEHEIAGCHLAELDSAAELILFLDRPGQSDAMPGEHILGEAAAIEPARVGSAVPVWNALESESGGDERPVPLLGPGRRTSRPRIWVRDPAR